MPQKYMPQEIEVWYVIPALRSALAKIFKEEYKITQKEIAKMLGITEAAVSQYTKNKRATDLKFSDKEMQIIKETAKKIKEDPKNIMSFMHQTLTKLRGSKTICALHRKHDVSIPDECKICMGN